jgi:hypothetical protein
MPDADLAQYDRLSPSAREWILERVAARLSANPPYRDEDEALAEVRAAIPEQIAFEKRQHRDDPILPMPDGYTVRTCRCRALTYVHHRTLSVLCPLTLARHQCADVPMREPATREAARRRHQQHERQAGRAAMAATREPREPRRIGIGAPHDNGV